MTTPFPQEAEREQLEQLLLTKRLIVCYGAGGVGKTTTSAALGIKAALLGRKVLVLTIDPAKRLADTLNISVDPTEARSISQEQFGQCGVSLSGSLDIWMLQPTIVFERLFQDIAVSPEHAEKLLNTKIFKELRKLVSGMQEYMAGESLYQFTNHSQYDLVILDTPPSRNAVDFLMAPDQLLGFLDSRIIKLFASSSGGFSLFGRARKVLQQVLKEVAGSGFISQMQEFVTLLLDSVEPLKNHATNVRNLLTSQRSGHILIASPAPEAIEEVLYFKRVLQRQRLPLSAMIINRSLAQYSAEDIEDYLEKNTRLSASEDSISSLALHKFKNFAELERKSSEKHQKDILKLRKDSRSAYFVLATPHIGGEIEDLKGLLHLSESL